MGRPVGKDLDKVIQTKDGNWHREMQNREMKCITRSRQGH